MLPRAERFAEAAGKCGFSSRTALAFGSDYAETLRRWRERFEAQAGAILALGFDEAFIRMWRLYLCYCEVGFDAGRTDVMQFLLTRRD
ncbi:cyclopropane fatty acyl phospholipid synthase [compost metagenome]